MRKGSLGSSLRGKSPIQDATGKVIGIVSVGYTIEQLENCPALRSLLILGWPSCYCFALCACRRFSLHIKNRCSIWNPSSCHSC
ncbi:hypothetical protein MJ579_04660 [Klebsiella pneumoniae]|nr:hypothetical protein MJ579_04660 [Klebsiella pneumoniae]